MNPVLESKSIDDFPSVDLDELLRPGPDQVWFVPDEVTLEPRPPQAYPLGAVKPRQVSRAHTFKQLPAYVCRLNEARYYGGPIGAARGSEYGLRVVEGGTMVTTANDELVPDSFFRDEQVPDAWIAEDSKPNELVLRAPVDFDRLDGVHLYLGIGSSHLGHTIVDGLSRLWPLVADPRFATVPIVYSGNHDISEGPTLELLARFNIDPGRFVRIKEPTIIESLLVPSRQFLPHVGGGPWFGKLLAEIGEGFTETTASNNRVFLSRSQWQIGRPASRPMVGEQAQRLDEFMDDHGFSVVHPETLNLRDQIQVVQRASHLVGAFGSASHLAAFAPAMPHHLVISPWHIFNWNDFGIHSVRSSSRLGVFVNDPHDTRHELTGEMRRRTPWRLRFARFRPAFEQWLATHDETNAA